MFTVQILGKLHWKLHSRSRLPGRAISFHTLLSRDVLTLPATKLFFSTFHNRQWGTISPWKLRVASSYLGTNVPELRSLSDSPKIITLSPLSLSLAVILFCKHVHAFSVPMFSSNYQSPLSEFALEFTCFIYCRKSVTPYKWFGRLARFVRPPTETQLFTTTLHKNIKDKLCQLLFQMQLIALPSPLWYILSVFQWRCQRTCPAQPWADSPAKATHWPDQSTASL